MPTNSVHEQGRGINPKLQRLIKNYAVRRSRFRAYHPYRLFDMTPKVPRTFKKPPMAPELSKFHFSEGLEGATHSEPANTGRVVHVDRPVTSGADDPLRPRSVAPRIVRTNAICSMNKFVRTNLIVIPPARRGLAPPRKPDLRPEPAGL